MVLRQLVFHLESTDGVDIVAEEINTVGILTTKGINVENRTAKGKLPWLIDIIHLTEAKVTKCFRNISDIDGLVFLQDEGTRVETFLRHHKFCQRLRIGHDIEQLILLCQPGHDLRAKDLTGCVALCILDGSTVTGRKKQHFATVQQLGQVMIEITRLLCILQDKQQTGFAL